MNQSKRLTLSLPLFGILTMLAASTVAAQPRPPARVAPETSGQASPPSSKGENFSANKTPAQLFQSDCTGAGCHKGPGGLAKGAGALGLTGFLREHYTNSRESAAALSAYLSGAAGAGPAEVRPGRGEPATPRPPRAAARTPAGEEAKPEEGQGPLTPARPRRQATPGAPGASAPAATPAAPAGETPAEIVRPEQGAKPAPAAAQQRNQPQRGQQRQHTTAAPPPAAPEAAPTPPPPPPPPVAHDIFD